MRYPAYIAGGAVIGASVFVAPAHAEQADAKSFVQEVSSSVISALKKTENNLPARREAFSEIFSQYADVPKIAQFTAGTAWRTADEAARAEYVNAFRKYMAHTYAVRVGEYGDEKVNIGRVSDLGSGKFVVETSVTQQNGQPPVSLNWQLKKEEAGLKLNDLRVENISMSLTQRAEFAALLATKNNSLAALTQMLNTRLR